MEGTDFDNTTAMWYSSDSCLNSTTNCSSLGSHGPISLTYSLPMMILVGSVLGVMMIATAIGNLLVGIALFRYRALRTVSNCLIGNLALSDFLLAIAVLPLSSINECLGYWPFGSEMCRAWLLADVLCCTASIWNLCIIAFDRFTATLYPVWYREARRPRQGVLYICIVWIVAVAVCVPPLTFLGETHKFSIEDNAYMCRLYDTPSYVLYSASASFYIPFFITFVMYLRIFTVLHARMQRMRARRPQKAPTMSRGRLILNRFSATSTSGRRKTPPPAGDSLLATTVTEEASSKSYFESYSSSKSGDEEDRSPTGQPSVETAIVFANGLNNSHLLTVEHAKLHVDKQPSAPSQRNRVATVLQRANPFKARVPHRTHRRKLDQREVRATIRMAIIIACFCGCWLGFFVLYVLGCLAPDWMPTRELQAFFFWLGYSNSAMNPLLYTIFNADFRQAFQKILGCRPQKRGSR